jgi:hypothetical protein
MGPANEKLLYISEMAGELLRLSDEMNLRTLSYLLRMARLEAETAEPATPLASDEWRARERRVN